MEPRKFWAIWILLVGVIVFSETTYLVGRFNPFIACPADAKECPNGSYVERTGPHCEFGVCNEETSTLALNVADWQTLTNSNGWSIRYPGDWKATGIGGVTADKSDGPVIQSPAGCFASGAQCGTMQIEFHRSNLDPQTFILNNLATASSSLGITKLSQGSVEIAGQLGYYVVYHQDNFGALPQGIIMKEVAVSYGSFLYDIHYSVETKDQASIQSINDWQLNSIFDAMIASFTLKSAEGTLCGGIAAFSCPSGYSCKLDGNYPDAGGHCVKQ